MNFRTKNLRLYKNKLIWLTDGQDAALNHQEQSSARFFSKAEEHYAKNGAGCYFVIIMYFLTTRIHF